MQNKKVKFIDELEKVIIQGKDLTQFEFLVTQKIHNYCKSQEFRHLNIFLNDLLFMINKITHIKEDPFQQVYYKYHFHEITLNFCSKNNIEIKQNELILIIQSYMDYAQYNTKNSINKIITLDSLNCLLDGLLIQNAIKKVDYSKLYEKIYLTLSDLNFFLLIHVETTCDSFTKLVDKIISDTQNNKKLELLFNFLKISKYIDSALNMQHHGYITKSLILKKIALDEFKKINEKEQTHAQSIFPNRLYCKI